MMSSNDVNKESNTNSVNKKIDYKFLMKLVLLPCFMFAFGFLLIPLYSVFCEITGLNGKFDSAEVQINRLSETASLSNKLVSKQVILQFTTASDHTQWQFKPEKNQLKIETGKQYKTHFLLHNPTSSPMEFTSIPSVSPGLAADYLIKTECFCFQKQTLAPYEKVEMPLIFQLRNDIPDEYKKLTLAYRIYAKPVMDKKEITLNTHLTSYYP